jgi:hypothetical protein
VPCLNPGMTWKLDPREVGWGTSGFTRKQAREARARLYTELFPLLEDKVARALRIPGR